VEAKRTAGAVRLCVQRPGGGHPIVPPADAAPRSSRDLDGVLLLLHHTLTPTGGSLAHVHECPVQHVGGGDAQALTSALTEISAALEPQGNDAVLTVAG
jgi:hypothetical protein